MALESSAWLEARRQLITDEDSDEQVALGAAWKPGPNIPLAPQHKEGDVATLEQLCAR